MSVFHASVSLLTMNFVMTLSNLSADLLGYRFMDPQVLKRCYDEIRDQSQDRRIEKLMPICKLTIDRSRRRLVGMGWGGGEVNTCV